MSPSADADVYAQIAELVARYADDDSPESAIGGLYLTRRCSPSGRLHIDQRPSFWLVAGGRKCLTVGDEELHYGVGDCLLVALDLPATARILQASEAEPHLCVGVAINPARLAELIGRLPEQASASPSGMRGVAVNPASPELLDATLRLLRLLERPADVAAMAPLIEQEILYRLLSGPHGARLLHIAMAEGQGHRVTRAVAWLREHFAQPLRIEALADHVGMSESSLHHHFKAVTNMTPMQYQKQLRLYEARRLMLVENMDVGTAGYSVGYQSPSQFSREYRRLYGLSPARDLEALRAPLAAE
ncbi:MULTISPECIES: AraC family transcriptional regulator [unclassified Caulobacter]|uniref:AraC family transcriptional regulator n=1 Tax=unclassified Caulobacter TaxID=2648921 RepID=UPI0006FE1A03|nr:MULTISPECIES: AraC family transcriptional regulator [unclassified Caulobacter]KQV55751.1 AraC family transcriptional regulator [Caulobacter sp. Root342]KQV71076.1 AraC family transcriptional regulator [Caulobacter sp. Root343]